MSDVIEKQAKQQQTSKHTDKEDTYFIFSSLLESGFSEVVCLTILYIVMTRKMRFSCDNK